MRAQRGLTLIEVLVVFLIILLIFSLMLPIIVGTRKKAQETTCISNMRQLVAAALQYRQDYGDFPPFIQYVYPYTKSKEVFLCPHDHAREHGGANALFGANPYATENNIALSYRYFSEPAFNIELILKLLPQADPNHGIIVCLLHGECKPECRNDIPFVLGTCCEGLTLRVRMDGSVQRAYTYLRRVSSSDGAPTYVRDHWKLFTDAPCPPEICPSQVDYLSAPP